MISTILLVIAGVVGLAAAWIAIRGHSQVFDLKTPIRPVDLVAFRNLVDPADEAFLRSRLNGKEFRCLKRLRTRAAIEYMAATAQNAGILFRVGQAASRSHDESVAACAQELAGLASSVRFKCLLACGKLYIVLLLPSLNWSMEDVFERYTTMDRCFATLTLVQHPESAMANSSL